MPLPRPKLAHFVTPIVAVCGSVWCATADAQRFLFEDTTEFELTAPQLELIPGTTQARLEQVRALASAGQWDDAIETLRDVAADDDGRLVAVSDGRYVGLKAYCQLQLSRMRAEALAAYRRQVDAEAERWYREGIANRDPAALRHVIDEMFCSSWGDDALLALGELALERADYAAAREAWQAISPFMRDPQGRPAWIALEDVDLRRHWGQIERRWHERPAPPDWLAYPDTDLELAEVRARLVLVSIREEDFDRAALELEVFRRFHGEAVGRLAGQEGPYAEALARLVKSAREWPPIGRETAWGTFAGSAAREGVAEPVARIDHLAWPVSIKLPEHDAAVRTSPAPSQTPRGAAVAVRESERPLCYHPLVVDRRVLYCDARRIYAAELATGKPAITSDGVLYQMESPAEQDTPVFATDAGAGVAGVPRYTMTVVDKVLYARLGEAATGRVAAAKVTRVDQRMVGVDLAREGLLTFQVRPENAAWSFDGVPVGDSRRVFVAMRHSDVRPGAHVAAFDASTGRRLWRTYLGAADTRATSRSAEEVTHNLLTLVGDRVFVNTNLGMVAALDAVDGRLCWLRRYDRARGRHSSPRPVHFDRDPSPCVYAGGLLFVAPSDTPAVFALDAETGHSVWSTERLANAAHLLGVVDGQLIASGHQLWSVDARSGHVRYVWPDSAHGGVRGFGRGVIAGREVFWPTRNEIYVFEATAGRQTRAPIDISAWTSAGANLVAADGYLLVAGPTQLAALGPQPAPPSQPVETNAEEAVAVSLSGTTSH